MDPDFFVLPFWPSMGTGSINRPATGAGLMPTAYPFPLLTSFCLLLTSHSWHLVLGTRPRAPSLVLWYPSRHLVLGTCTWCMVLVFVPLLWYSGTLVLWYPSRHLVLGTCTWCMVLVFVPLLWYSGTFVLWYLSRYMVLGTWYSVPAPVAFSGTLVLLYFGTTPSSYFLLLTPYFLFLTSDPIFRVLIVTNRLLQRLYKRGQVR
jgi:hypothetical protein